MFQTNHNSTNQKKEKLDCEKISIQETKRTYENIMVGFGPMFVHVNGLGLIFHVRVKIKIFI